jgi:hypothetical protein
MFSQHSLFFRVDRHLKVTIINQNVAFQKLQDYIPDFLEGPNGPGDKTISETQEIRKNRQNNC